MLEGVEFNAQLEEGGYNPTNHHGDTGDHGTGTGGGGWRSVCGYCGVT